MAVEINEIHDTSYDVDDADNNGADAVEYDSREYPVVPHLVLLVILIALLFLFVNSSLKKISDFLQHDVRLIAFRRLRGWRRELIVLKAVFLVAVADVNIPNISVYQARFRRWRRRLLHTHARCQSLAQNCLHLL